MTAEELLKDYLAALKTRRLGRAPEFFDEIDSTNNHLKRRAASEDFPPSLVSAALSQTGGRGRLGRSWLSRRGAGLYISFLSEPVPAALLPLVPLAAGNAAVAACRVAGGVKTGIKWPNDIVACGRKLAGILCEGASGRAIIGIGINLTGERAEFDSLNLPNATSLSAETGGVTSPGALAAALALYLERELDSLTRQGAQGVLSRCRAACVTLGREALAITADGELRGVAVDIDSAGRLILETAAGRVALLSGEVRVRTAGGAYA